MQKKYYLGVDLGGTKVGIGIVDQDATILCQLEFPTITEENELSKKIYEYSLKLLEQKGISLDEIISMGIGVPGTVDQTKKIIVYANNLEFRMVPMVELLQQYFSFPIYMDNDANVAAWAEYKAGACKGSELESMIMVTLGTGVGAGFILHGKLFSGCNQGAGEIGHMVIDRNGIPCNCGRRGCYESYASTTALIQQTRKAMQKDNNSILWKLCGGDIEKMNGKYFFEAVNNEDRTAKEVLKEFQGYVTIGLLNLINIFQPDMIVIGGGISKVGDVLLNPIKEDIKQLVYTRDDLIQTQIVRAHLGNEAGIIGAALLQ